MEGPQIFKSAPNGNKIHYLYNVWVINGCKAKLLQAVWTQIFSSGSVTALPDLFWICMYAEFYVLFIGIKFLFG